MSQEEVPQSGEEQAPETEPSPAEEQVPAEGAGEEEKAPEPAPEVEAARPEQPSPPRRRGCGLLGWIVILAVALAVAAYLVHKAQVEELRRRQEEQMKRKSVRAAQLQQVGQELAAALEAAQAGDIARALVILDSQSSILSSIATEASASSDAEDANDAVEKKRIVSQIANSIRQKQEEVKAFAVSEISRLATQFPQVRKAAAQPAPKAPAEEAKAGEKEKPAAEAEPSGETKPRETQPPAAPPAQKGP